MPCKAVAHMSQVVASPVSDGCKTGDEILGKREASQPPADHGNANLKRINNENDKSLKKSRMYAQRTSDE